MYVNTGAVSEQTVDVLKEPLSGSLMGQIAKQIKRHQVSVASRKWGEWLGKCPTKVMQASSIEWGKQTAKTT